MVDVNNEAGRTAILGVLSHYDLGPEQAQQVIEALKPVSANLLDLDAVGHLGDLYAAFFHSLVNNGLERDEALVLTSAYLQILAGRDD